MSVTPFDMLHTTKALESMPTQLTFSPPSSNVQSQQLPITNSLQLIFDLIYKNNITEDIKHYFTDVYVYCLHKDPLNPTIGIPSAIQQIIASHVARRL
jgi:hypothetical protein